MLETNQKFRTIIVERRTKAGKWVFHSKVIQENPFTVTKFDEEEEDGYIICGKVVFNNGLTVTAAFYR